MILDFSSLDTASRYKAMSNTIVPRPIAWVVTEGKALNIAPFSYFTGLSSEPPTLLISVGHKADGSPKDTLKNILEKKKCTICSVTPSQLTKMDATAASLDEEVSEAEAFAIETKKLLDDFPPIIQGSPAAFFCTLYQKVDLQGSKTVPLILKIEHFFLEDSLYDEKLHFSLSTVARIGHGYGICDKNISP